MKSSKKASKKSTSHGSGPQGGVEIFRKRRHAFLNKIQNGTAVLFAHPEQLRNDDVHHDYRQDSTLYYLTGYPEPETVAVFKSEHKNKVTLFVREKDATRELWDGFRFGIEGAEEHFGVDAVHSINELEKLLPELIKGSQNVYFRINEIKEHDEIMMKALDGAKKLAGRAGRERPTIIDVKTLVGEMRLIKKPEELDLLKKACEISAQGHLRAMRATKPGMFEYEIQAEVESEFKRLGAQRLGYNSIVGRGPNATILHYVLNNDQCKKDDMVLIDAGAEYGYMTGDITRTYPVSGQFTKAQRKLYEVVLKAQKSCIKFVKPGVTMTDIHNHAIEQMTEGMLELGILKGNITKIIEKKEYFKYFPHGTGHWLGMDVHDAGIYLIDGKPRKLETNMCFTIEPGLYIPKNDKQAPEEYRGMGIRIEDDVYVTAKGCEVMTSAAPKEVDDLEDVIGKSV